MKTCTTMSKIRSDWAAVSMAKDNASAKRRRIGRKKRGKPQPRTKVTPMSKTTTNCSKRTLTTTILLVLVLMRQQQCHPLLLPIK